MVREMAPNLSRTTSPASAAPAHAGRTRPRRCIEPPGTVAAEVTPSQPAPSRLPRGVPYLRLRTRYLLIAVVSFAWAALSLYIALPWISQLGASITVPLAVAVVLGIAIVPGYLNAHLFTALLLEKPPPLRFDGQFPAVTVVVATYNEAGRIGETLSYLQRQDYPGHLRILVADDGSTDQSREIASRAALDDPRISLIALPHGGKAHALTSALAEVKTAVVATVDADTLLSRKAFIRSRQQEIGYLELRIGNYLINESGLGEGDAIGERLIRAEIELLRGVEKLIEGLGVDRRRNATPSAKHHQRDRRHPQQMTLRGHTRRAFPQLDHRSSPTAHSQQ